MSGIFELFNERAKRIERRLIGYDRVPVAFFNTRPERKNRALAAIGQQARADKADPFLFDRLMSLIVNGAATIEDYDCVWAGERKETAMLAAFRKCFANLPETVEVLSPRNLKRA